MAERPEDLNLPNAVITRIIKEALPDGVNISKEARSAISRAASVFVLYATSWFAKARTLWEQTQRNKIRAELALKAHHAALELVTHANNFAMKGKRKTLNAGDVLSAMEEMEFQRFIAPLKESLEVYRREQKGKKEARKDKDKKADSEEQDKNREDDNDDDDERMEDEEQNDEEEVDN